MQPKPGQVLELVDAQRRRLGRVALEGSKEGRLEGTFTPGPDYSAVASLFHALGEAADLQALSAVDRIDAQVAALGLQLRSQDGAAHSPVHDVQIWADGAMTCRMTPPASPPFNGGRPTNQASPEMYKGIARK
jgi:hypothetical protein